MVFAVAGIGFALFVLVIAQVLLGQAGFRVAGVQARVEQKRLVAQQLEVDVQRMRAPARIAARAAALGMVPAGDVTVLVDQPVPAPSPVRGPASKRGKT